MGGLLERGLLGFSLSSIVLEHFQNLIDGVVGVVEDRHIL